MAQACSSRLWEVKKNCWEFKASLGYIISSRPVWGTVWDPLLIHTYPLKTKKICYTSDITASVLISAVICALLGPSFKMPLFLWWTATCEGCKAGGNMLLKLWIAFSHQFIELTCFRFCLSTYKNGIIVTVPVRWVEIGILKSFMVVTVAPVNVTCIVKFIEMYLETEWSSS